MLVSEIPKEIRFQIKLIILMYLNLKNYKMINRKMLNKNGNS